MAAKLRLAAQYAARPRGGQVIAEALSGLAVQVSKCETLSAVQLAHMLITVLKGTLACRVAVEPEAVIPMRDAAGVRISLMSTAGRSRWGEAKQPDRSF